MNQATPQHHQNQQQHQSRHAMKPLGRPMTPNTFFNAGFGARYAEELRQLQQSGQLGAMHSTSHSLEKSDLLISQLVSKGLNNIAQLTMPGTLKKATVAIEANRSQQHKR